MHLPTDFSKAPRFLELFANSNLHDAANKQPLGDCALCEHIWRACFKRFDASIGARVRRRERLREQTFERVELVPPLLFCSISNTREWAGSRERGQFHAHALAIAR
jgi:hypothetical protein